MGATRPASGIKAKVYSIFGFGRERPESPMEHPAQGKRSDTLGWVLHWAFSPPMLNPKLEKDSLIGVI